MFVQQLCRLHEHTRQPYRPLCRSIPVAYSSFMRWKGRAERGEPLLQQPGPRPVGPLDLDALRARLRELKHGAHRSHGAPALYAAHRAHISRRAFQQLLEQTRHEVHRERQAEQQRVQWNVPGAVWSIDPTELVVERDGLRQKLRLLPVLDLASRYKFAPLINTRLNGEAVAGRLEQLFHSFGPPLVLKRDNGSDLNHHTVDEVLARWRVIPLNSPPHYPPYNGGMERAQRELKDALRPQLLVGNAATYTGLAALTVHDLNHRPRRCLRGHTACEMFAGAKHHRRGYTARQRKDAFDWISELAMNLMLEQPARTRGHADAAWRQAVETWLQQHGIITISEPKSVTQFP